MADVFFEFPKGIILNLNDISFISPPQRDNFNSVVSKIVVGGKEVNLVLVEFFGMDESKQKDEWLKSKALYEKFIAEFKKVNKVVTAFGGSAKSAEKAA